MLSTIKNTIMLAAEFKGVIYDLLSSPIESARLVAALFEIKQKLAQDDKIKGGFEAAQILLTLKKQSPDDFEALLAHIEKAIDIYKKNPGEVAQKIRALLDDIK